MNETGSASVVPLIKYRLADQVNLQKEPAGGGCLFISRPQRIIKLSPGGMALLQELLDHGITDMSSAAAEFAVNLENQGILVRQFPSLAGELLPSVTVIIPTYGRPKMLDKCLASLTALDYPPDRLEIIVVDDASPEPLASANWDSKVQLVRQQENKGPGAARNLAVQQAKGEIIAFLDDDCAADKDWLRSLVPGFQSADVAVVGGRVESADITNSLGKYEQVMSPLLMGDIQRKVRQGSSLSYLATCNFLIKKTSFLAAGGFDPGLRVGEDVDLCWRVLETGANIYYLPQGVVFHYHRTQLISFLKRRYNYGQSEAQLHRKHRPGHRRLSLFPGHIYIFPAALVIALSAGSMMGKDTGLLAGLASLILLDLLNLGFRITGNLYKLNSAGYIVSFGQVSRAVSRAHNSSFYLYSQNFSRYYSIILTLLAVPLSPMAVWLLLIFHIWPAVVDYGLKKPNLGRVLFILYYSLENCFYQAGVLNGCWRARNWHPLLCDFTPTGEAAKWRTDLTK